MFFSEFWSFSFCSVLIALLVPTSFYAMIQVETAKVVAVRSTRGHTVQDTQSAEQWCAANLKWQQRWLLLQSEREKQ